jgi:hypothetical protein
MVWGSRLWVLASFSCQMLKRVVRNEAMAITILEPHLLVDEDKQMQINHRWDQSALVLDQ